jgi:hypothetical protein
MPAFIKVITVAIVSTLLTACVGAYSISPVVKDYKRVANQVSLGQSKSQVLSILSPSQKNLSAEYSKSPDQYMQDSSLIEIYYMRSGWTSDGLTTDDEFTPYVFKDGILVAIGWASLGGPKSTGQVVPRSNNYPVYQPSSPSFTNCNRIGNSVSCTHF